MEAELEISTDPARLDVGVVCEYLQSSYWASGRPRRVIEMRAVLDHPELQHLRVFLLATREAHGLYAKFGFRPLEEPERWMAIHHRDR